jgi:hypothetical protein
MKPKVERKPKLTDAERHKRFLEEARRAGASDDPEDFDKAFRKVISKAPNKTASQVHHSQNRSRRSRDEEGSQ